MYACIDGYMDVWTRNETKRNETDQRKDEEYMERKGKIGKGRGTVRKK